MGLICEESQWTSDSPFDPRHFYMRTHVLFVKNHSGTSICQLAMFWKSCAIQGYHLFFPFLGIWCLIIISATNEQDVWQGTQLLAIDVAAASGLIRRVLIGDELTEKEKKALQRTLTDLASVVPIGVLMLLPVSFNITLFHWHDFPTHHWFRTMRRKGILEFHGLIIQGKTHIYIQ